MSDSTQYVIQACGVLLGLLCLVITFNILYFDVHFIDVTVAHFQP